MRRNDNYIETANDEIAFADIFRIMRGNLKGILSAGLVGVAMAVGYLVFASPKYEASAIIAMAQMRTDRHANGTVILSEPPALLIERLRIPDTYTTATINACGMKEAPKPREAMASMVDASQHKNLPSIVIVKVNADTRISAKECVLSLFGMVRDQQAEMLKPIREEFKGQLSALERRYQNNRAFISKMEKSGLDEAAYMIKHDEQLYLYREIDELRQVVSRDSQTRLVSPVNVSNEPVSPKQGKTVLQGALIGLIIGMFVALAWRSSRRHNNGK